MKQKFTVFEASTGRVLRTGETEASDFSKLTKAGEGLLVGKHESVSVPLFEGKPTRAEFNALRARVEALEARFSPLK